MKHGTRQWEVSYRAIRFVDPGLFFPTDDSIDTGWSTETALRKQESQLSPPVHNVRAKVS